MNLGGPSLSTRLKSGSGFTTKSRIIKNLNLMNFISESSAQK